VCVVCVCVVDARRVGWRCCLLVVVVGAVRSIAVAFSCFACGRLVELSERMVLSLVVALLCGWLELRTVPGSCFVERSIWRWSVQFSASLGCSLIVALHGVAWSYGNLHCPFVTFVFCSVSPPLPMPNHNTINQSTEQCRCYCQLSTTPKIWVLLC